MSTFVLYSTLGCHLCELAKAIIDPLMDAHNLSYSEVDIADDDALVEAYGVLIPVFKHFDSESYLNWPFEVDDVVGYLVKL